MTFPEETVKAERVENRIRKIEGGTGK